jgi:hypothetical protein
MTEEVMNTKQEIVNLQLNTSMYVKLKKLYSNSDGDWKKLYDAFVPVDNVVPFIVALESLGTETGGEVSVTSIDSVKPEEGNLSVNGYVNARVTAKGSWTSVFKILKLAENMPYMVTISNVRVDISTGDIKKSDVEWVVSFDISAVKSI